ncbi:hypothetical protein LSCM1_03340 [Leishmania martiniquensis]|uniref:non-specific serine/threonine protein kinase n=1 Tax=Leishmania martiniquensis TaxID=1580590 RepID=A0A836HD58_9TRYP|nr:hypothetical protein LSCM1_03340 [Leishmania martiniquensis]
MEIASDFARRDLRFIGFLGCGAFGETYLVRDASGTCLVVKRSRSLVKRCGFLEEFLGMMNLCSLHVVAAYDAWIDHEGRVCILMEYCDAGDLGDYIEKGYPLSEEEVLSIVAQLLLGLDHIHKKNRVHRDIKPENIFLSAAKAGCANWPVAKLGDFGSIRRLPYCGARVVSRVGTPLYLAPEIVAGYAYTSKADIWSMGLVVYRLMMNKLPFGATTVEGHTRRILRLRPPHPSAVSGYSRALGDCVMAMLSRNWKRRPSAEALLRCDVFQMALVRHLWLRAPPQVSPCLFVRRRRALFTVHAESSESAQALRTLQFGDQVYLSSCDLMNCSRRGRWLELLFPVAGFIRDGSEMEDLLDSYTPDECTVNVGSLTRGLDGVAKDM